MQNCRAAVLVKDVHALAFLNFRFFTKCKNNYLFIFYLKLLLLHILLIRSRSFMCAHIDLDSRARRRLSSWRMNYIKPERAEYKDERLNRAAYKSHPPPRCAAEIYIIYYIWNSRRGGKVQVALVFILPWVRERAYFSIACHSRASKSLTLFAGLFPNVLDGNRLESR